VKKKVYAHPSKLVGILPQSGRVMVATRVIRAGKSILAPLTSNLITTVTRRKVRQESHVLSELFESGESSNLLFLDGIAARRC